MPRGQRGVFQPGNYNERYPSNGTRRNEQMYEPINGRPRVRFDTRMDYGNNTRQSRNYGYNYTKNILTPRM